MNKTTLTLIAYSTLLIIGGIIGYIKAGSPASLIMSSTFAFLILISLYLRQQYPVWGYKLTYVLITALSLFFTYRTLLTGKFMPSGMLALISIAVLNVMYFSKRLPQASI